MKLTFFEIVLIVLGGAGISVGAGMFKDWLKKILPTKAAYIGGFIFLLCAAASIIINRNKVKREEDDVVQKNPVIYRQDSMPVNTPDSQTIKLPDTSVVTSADTPVVKQKEWVIIKKQILKMPENVSRTLPEGPRFSFKSFSDVIYVNFFFQAIILIINK